MNIRISQLLLPILLLTVGCIENHDLAVLDGHPDPITILPTEPTASGGNDEPVDPPVMAAVPGERGWGPANGAEPANCDLDLAWTAPATGDNFAQPRGFAVSPDGRLVIGGGLEFSGATQAYSTIDGEPLFAITDTWGPGNMGPRWQVRAEIEHAPTGRHLILRPLLEAEEFWRVELPSDSHQHRIKVSPSGARVVMTSCNQGDTTIQAFNSLTGELQAEHEIPGVCMWTRFAQTPLFAVDHHGVRVVLGGEQAQALLVIDLAAGTTRELNTQNATDFRPEHFLNLALNPASDRLFAIQNDGQIIRWSFPGFEVLDPIGNAAIIAINPTTYMPSTESPMAFSAGGEQFAYVNRLNEIVVVDSEDGTLLHVVESPNFELDDRFGAGNTGDEPVGLAFTPNGAGLVVSFTGGLAAYRCAGARDPATHDRVPVMLEGPAVISVGEVAIFTATHLGTARLHGHAFYVDGVLIAEPTTGRQAQWIPDAPGIYEVVVEIMDGLDTGEKNLFVEVVEN